MNSLVSVMLTLCIKIPSTYIKQTYPFSDSLEISGNTTAHFLLEGNIYEFLFLLLLLSVRSQKFRQIDRCAVTFCTVCSTVLSSGVCLGCVCNCVFFIYSYNPLGSYDINCTNNNNRYYSSVNFDENRLPSPVIHY